MATATTARSCQDTKANTTIDTTRIRALTTNMSRPIWTSSARLSMSEVMRDTSTPAFSRS